MFNKLLTNDIYVKVSENLLEARNVSLDGEWQQIRPESSFTTQRLLVGNFSVAEVALRQLIKSVLPKKFFAKRPQVLIQPIFAIDGDISEIETRIFTELALGAGAIKVALHQGNELSNDEVKKRLNSV